MQRMEKGRLISGHYEQKEIRGHTITERRYKLLAAGHRALETAQLFYVQRNMGKLHGGLESV